MEDPAILSGRWLTIGRQARTHQGGFFNLLASLVVRRVRLIYSGFNELADRRHRQEQAPGIVYKSQKAVFPVECHRGIVSCVHNQRLYGKDLAGEVYPIDGIHQQVGTNTLPLAAFVDGEPSKQGSGHGIMGKPLCLLGRQRVLLEAGGAQAVIAYNDIQAGIGRNKNSRHVPPDILGSNFPNIPVQLRCATRKRRSHMNLAVEGHDPPIGTRSRHSLAFV